MQHEVIDRADLYVRRGAVAARILQHQVFGHFTGETVLDDGTRVQLDHFLGFAQEVFNAW